LNGGIVGRRVLIYKKGEIKMAIVLWKENGFKICDESSFTQELKNGWFLSKAEAKATAIETVAKVAETKAETKVEAEVETKVETKVEAEVEKFKKAKKSSDKG